MSAFASKIKQMAILKNNCFSENVMLISKKQTCLDDKRSPKKVKKGKRFFKQKLG
jgi:hypothetical protein